jgi:hypothetical protein
LERIEVKAEWTEEDHVRHNSAVAKKAIAIASLDDESS